jgi:LmbE family N-acetylglucosaminyl deacetylase
MLTGWKRGSFTLLAIATCFLVGCADADSGHDGGALHDTGSRDGGAAQDAGGEDALDAGFAPDADAGVIDAGLVDAGPVDAGPIDASSVDAGPPRRIIFFGAHPDDEVTIAPLLGRECVARGAVCRLVVATRGEGGTCNLPLGCLPDLGTVREHEMTVAADLFRASLVQGDLPNGSSMSERWQDAITRWSAFVDGGEEGLVALAAQQIIDFGPDLILSFDPRHGTTCHSEHRALGHIVQRAVATLGATAPVLHLIAHVRAGEAGRYAAYAPAVPSDALLQSYDATEYLENIDGEAWEYVSLDIDAHPSQQDATFSRSLAEAAPARLRQLYFVDSIDAITDSNPAYDEICP